MMTTHDELLPCPFCGSEAEIVRGDEAAAAQCLDCKAHRLVVSGDNNAADEVARLWNRRAPTPLPADAPSHTDLMVSPESIDAFLEANPPPAEAQGEWVLVPREPTEAMLDAVTFEPTMRKVAKGSYRAMLSAAPPAPAPDTAGLRERFEAAIAKLTYMTSGKIGQDWRSGRPFVLPEKGDVFAALVEACAVLRKARAVVETFPTIKEALKIADARIGVRLPDAAIDEAQETSLREAGTALLRVVDYYVTRIGWADKGELENFRRALAAPAPSPDLDAIREALTAARKAAQRMVGEARKYPAAMREWVEIVAKLDAALAALKQKEGEL